MRWRVSGESGMFDEFITSRIRDTRSKTEMTSSLTTAAILISGAGEAGRCSGVWPPGACCGAAAGGVLTAVSGPRTCAGDAECDHAATATTTAHAQRNPAIPQNPVAADLAV